MSSINRALGAPWRGELGHASRRSHPTKSGKVTVVTGDGLNEEVKPGTLGSIERQAGWRP